MQETTWQVSSTKSYRSAFRCPAHDLHFSATRPSADTTAASRLRRPLLVSPCAAGAAAGTGRAMVVADEFRDTLAGIYPGIGGAEGQPKAEPLASSADRRWHVHDVPGLALALASGLGDGGAAGCHRSGQHGVHRAWPRTAAARLFLLCAGDAAAGVAAFRSLQHRGLAHCLR